MENGFPVRTLGYAFRMEPLVDGWGREIKSLRVSVTDKCNFRCRYCMPAEGLEWLPRDEVLSFEEIERLVRVLAAMGVEEVRLTGGEPLIRRDLPVLVEKLAARARRHRPVADDERRPARPLAAPLVAAGLRRVNVCLDTLSHTRFAEMTRRDALDRVLAGLAAAEQLPELRPIKVNAVAIKGFTETEVPALAELARRKPYVVRFIEFMPLDADGSWRNDEVLTGARSARSSRSAGRSRRSRRSRRRRRAASASPTAPARSGSSTPSPSRSARAATGSGSPPTGSCAPASSPAASGT